MNAIAGFWSFGSGDDSIVQCRRMLASLSVYGTHASDAAEAEGLALGRNLHRSLPEDAHDRQPLVGGDGRFRLVADIRLDNRDELRSALGLSGADAANLSDSAILLRALERWSDGALERIAGDYAFAFFDRERRQLLLARDPIGQRPLFWHRGGDFFAFASMPRGLHALDEIARRPDVEAVITFIGALPRRGPRSFYDGVQRVEPGHLLVVSPDAERSRRTWNPARTELRLPRFDDYVDAFREQVDRAVADRLRGAGSHVASHLSGGWDSGAVTATAAQLLARSGGRVSAYTSVPNPAFAEARPRNRFADEGPIAARTAAFHSNIDHRLLENPGRSPLADLDAYVAAYDRPLYNLCNHVWLGQIRCAARGDGADILLTGEIGNWTISAAPHNLLAEYVRRGRMIGWAREATALLVARKRRLRGIAASSFGPWVPRFLWNRFRHLSSAPELGLATPIHPDLRETLAARQEAEQVGLARRPRDNFAQTVEALREMDYGEYRKGVLAGWGLDKRDPTADVRLIGFCLSLPLDMLLKNGVRRPLARAALADRLPASILDEKQKGYQAADWSVGLGRDLANASALIDRMAADSTASSVIDIEGLRALVRDWPKEGWADLQVVARYRVGLLVGLSAGHFLLAAKG